MSSTGNNTVSIISSGSKAKRITGAASSKIKNILIRLKVKLVRPEILVRFSQVEARAIRNIAPMAIVIGMK